MTEDQVTGGFFPSSLKIIDAAKVALEEIGTQMTARQVFYQLVGKNVVENTQAKYRAVVRLLVKARYQGLIGWGDIGEHGRDRYGITTYETPWDAIEAVQTRFRLDWWKGQERRPEVWVEKDALLNVIAPVCNEYRVDYRSFHGVTSWTVLHDVAQEMDPDSVAFFLSDHDPAGVYMIDDIRNRLDLLGWSGEVQRIALTTEQVEQHRLPPNTAKERDPHYEDYQREYGEESWELDALRPAVIAAEIESHVKDLIDWELWEKQKELESEAEDKLSDLTYELRGMLDSEEEEE